MKISNIERRISNDEVTAPRGVLLRRSIFGVRYSILAVLILLLISGCARETPETTITVSAAASLKDALTELDTLFEKAHPGTELRHNFAASGTLQQQIERGAPVDVYIAAAAKNMDELETKKLIMPGTRSTLARNELVVVVPRDGKINIRDVSDLQKEDVKRISIGAPDSVPAGKYAKQTLTKSKLWDALQPKLVQAKDVREVLAQVALGNVEAGFVYATDAKISDRVRVAVKVSLALHEPIVYPLAVVGSTPSAAQARAYVEYLQTPDARVVLQRYGFVAP